MITLLIANDEKIINDVSEAARSSGSEIITYRWLLKALDNITEISPDLIIVNSCDYPRHWKSLCSFVNTLHYCNSLAKLPAILLITGPRFSPEDEEKGDILGVQAAYRTTEARDIDGFIKEMNPGRTAAAVSHIPSPVQAPQPQQFVDATPSVAEDTAESSFAEEPSTEAAAEETASQSEPEAENEKKEDEYQFVFTNPFNDLFITGKVTNFDRNQITFIPDILTHTLQLSTGTALEKCTLSKNGEVRNIKAQVFSVADTAPYSLELYLEG